MRPAAAIGAGALALALAALAGACGSKGKPPPLGYAFQDAGSGGSGGSGGFDAGNVGPPPPDASGLCGNQIVPVVVDRPNLYFVIDRSGSMGDYLSGSGYDKYVNARVAIQDLLIAVGYRVAVGAAVFPDSSSDQCAPGIEVFPTRAGDPSSYAASKTAGPVTLSLMSKLAQYSPAGGTPTSPTLKALMPTLLALSGRTYVVLATDGAPNCNPTATCVGDECMLNIDNFVLDNGQACDSTFNCCDPANVVDGQYNCVDADASEAAVKALADAGIQTYVVGMPGSELYASVLDRMAVAGGTARASEPKYYATTSTTELTAAVKQIGFSVAISCDIKLDEAPPDKSLVNVYFDSTLVPSDAVDGWMWTGADSISIVGPACDQLKSGDVFQVQVAAGCPTQVR